MQSYSEGDLVFSFPLHWGVRPYDQHTYYRGLSGLGLKGVDFLLIDPGDDGATPVLYFLEVKNYRTRTTEDGIFVATPKAPDQLAETMARKYADTKKAIQAIYGYYRRSWWFRQFEPWLVRSKRSSFDRVFWTQAHYLMEQGQAVEVLLWLELEQKDIAYREALDQALERRLGSEVSVKLLHEQHAYPLGIRARFSD